MFEIFLSRVMLRKEKIKIRNIPRKTLDTRPRLAFGLLRVGVIPPKSLPANNLSAGLIQTLINAVQLDCPQSLFFLVFNKRAWCSG